jgi:microcystin-dependent protein
VPVGKDNMGGSAANRITGGGSGITGTTLGASGGAETVALTSAQGAAHTHSDYYQVTSGILPQGNADGGGTDTIGGVSESGASTTSGAASASGSAHNNTQPTLIFNYLIKT